MSVSNISLMLLILCFSAFLYDASALNSDGATLLSLLTHWTFVPPIINSTWNASHSVPCSWHGVQCSHAYHVKSLNLTDLGIHGQLGPEIGQLYRLKILVLSNNGFSGKVPSELSNCSLLELLDLSNNMFNGELPLEMENLMNLKNISLFSNQFSGVIPQNLGINNSLVKLDFTNNKFTGKLPSNLCFRKRLRMLNMGSNQLYGSIPSDLGRCPILVMLILSENNFTGSLPVFESNVNLKYLHISKNKISGPIPRSLENCTNIAAINMSINNFTGLIPSALGKLVNLTILDISHNNLEGPLPPQLSNCTKMDHFDVGFNSLNGSFPSSLRNWTEITTLVLRENHFTGGIPGFFSEFSKLRELQLGGNLIGGAIPPSLGKLKNLFYGLNLSSNGLTGVIPIELGYLQELQSLDLSLNNLTGNLDALDKLPSLIEINISYNFFSGPLPETLFKFLSSSPSLFLGNRDLCVSCSPSSGLNCTNSSYLKPCPYRGTDHKSITSLVILMIELGSSLFVSALLVALLWMYLSRRERKNDVYDEKWGSIFEREAGRIGFLYKEELKFTENQSASLHDIVMEATDNLNDQYIIGRGAHGIIYRAQLGEMAFAVKKIAFERNKRKQLHAMRKEIELLGKIKHRNLVTYADYWIGENYGMVLYEYMKNGSLLDILHDKYPPSPLSWNVRLNIAVGIAHGLKYLHHDHTVAIVHRDIKPQNILLNDDMEPLISDFGIALYRDLSEHSYSQSWSGKELSTYVAGTVGYIAPENAYVKVQSRKSDVYSYGVVLLELLTRKRVFIEEGGNVTNLASWVKSIWLETGKVEQIIDSDLANAFPSSVVLANQVTKVLSLALSCTQIKPRNRPSMKVIIDFYQQHIFKLNCYDVDVGVNDLVDGFMVELIGNEDVKQEILEPCLLVHDIGAVSPLRGHLHSSYPIDSWVKPADGFVKVNCDGCVYVDEGQAGFGCVLRDSSGRWIFGFSGLVLGTCILRTELWAIWRGLYMALEQNQTAVECETDSVDAFYLVNHCQIPQEHEEKELIQKIFELKVRPGWNVTFKLIHRGANRVADCMAKLGARANGVAIDWIHPPSGLQQLLELDKNEGRRAEITVLEREPAIRTNNILEKKLKTYTKKELSCIHDIVMEATENLNHRYIIGQGAHGVVYKVQHPNLTCAAKKIAFGGKNEKRFITMRTEIETLKLIRHRNLVEYKACLLAENYGLILCDYMENGCLHDILHGMNPSPLPLKWDLRLAIAGGIAKGLRYLHHDCNPPIVHRDIKPKNILLDATLEPHIADFGIAFVRNLGQHKVSAYLKGTIGYIAPECAYSVVPSTKWDVYSYGVVLLELITRKKAVIENEEDNPTGLVSWVRSIWVETNRIDEIVDSELVRAFPYSEELAKQVMELFLLALSCTERDPRNRPTMKDVIVGLFQKGMLRWSCKPVLFNDPVSVVH